MIGTFLVSFEGLFVAIECQTLCLLPSITCDYVSNFKIQIFFFSFHFLDISPKYLNIYNFSLPSLSKTLSSNRGQRLEHTSFGRKQSQ